jgi:hypothetical protein
MRALDGVASIGASRLGTLAIADGGGMDSQQREKPAEIVRDARPQGLAQRMLSIEHRAGRKAPIEDEDRMDDAGRAWAGRSVTS